MLELGCARQVFRDGGPSIVPVLSMGATEGYHRFNGECHSRGYKGSGGGVVEVGDLEPRLKDVADSMAAIVPHHPHAFSSSIGLDSLAYNP